MDVRWTARPGQEDEPGIGQVEDALVMGLPEFVVAPEGVGGLIPGTKLYIGEVVSSKLPCSQCSSVGCRSISLRGTDVFILACASCSVFSWCR